MYYVGAATRFIHTPELLALETTTLNQLKNALDSKIASASLEWTMAAVDSFQLLHRELSRSCSPYFETLALVGALYTASRAIILLRDCCLLIRVHFLPRMIPRKKLNQRFGDWAVVYGKRCCRRSQHKHNGAGLSFSECHALTSQDPTELHSNTSEHIAS